MKKLGVFVAVILGLSLVAGMLLGGCSAENTAKLKVVTSTSLIAQIAERIGGDKVEVVNIIPPAQCPGHFDVKPGDIQKLADARLFIIHNWQGEKFSDEIVASADNKDLIMVKVEIAGNWMTPSVQKEAADKIAAALIDVDPDNTSAYQKGADEYKSAVTAKESEVKEQLGQVDFAAVSVLCDEQQAGFVNWSGFNVIATYGRPETFTPQIVKELVDKGRESGVTLVIDNMQTGGESGKSLAEELGVNQVTLSNFPGGYDDTETWEKALDKNIDLLLKSVAE